MVRTIELDDGPATSLALNGARALTGHANGKVVLWDIDRAEKIATVQRNEANIWAVAFTGDPDRFAAASHDWKVTLWDARQPAAPLQVLDGHENAVQALAYSPQRLLLASGGADKTVRVWNLDTLDLKRAYRGPRDFVTSVAFSPNGKLLAAGGARRPHSSMVGAVVAPPAHAQRSSRTRRRHRLLARRAISSPRRARTARCGCGICSADASCARLPATSAVRLRWRLRPTAQHLASAGVDGRVRLWAIPLGPLARE